jgi:hypothetical protein
MGEKVVLFELYLFQYFLDKIEVGINSFSDGRNILPWG